MRLWDKLVNKKNGLEGMVVAIDSELGTVDVKCGEDVKTLTLAQLERYWYTSVAIDKPGPKPKHPGGRPRKPEKRGPKPKPKYNPYNRGAHRSKYAVGTIARYYDTHKPAKKPKRKELPVNEILEYVKDIAINQYGMKFEEVNERDFKFRTPYTGDSNIDGFSKQCTLMVRLYKTQVNIYTKSEWLTEEQKHSSRMIYQKYYYDKMLRIPNFTDATKEFIKGVIESVNVNYKEIERPKTYNRVRGKKRSTAQKQKMQAGKDKSEE